MLTETLTETLDTNVIFVRLIAQEELIIITISLPTAVRNYE
jgi:hypothetical protein